MITSASSEALVCFWERERGERGQTLLLFSWSFWITRRSVTIEYKFERAITKYIRDGSTVLGGSMFFAILL